jgi:hypothetical protein
MSNVPQWVILNGLAVPVGTGSAIFVTGNGLWHSTSSTLDPAAYIGTSDQILVTNHAATDTAWISLAGDATYASGSLTVVALQGNAVSSAGPTNGQVLQWVSATSKWTPTTTTSALTAFNADLSTTSTATAQYVQSLSYSATAFGHGAGAPINVNGTGVTLNWVDDKLKLQYTSTTVVQLSQAATDFAAFGVSPGTSGFIRSPLNSVIIGANSTTVLGIDATGNVQVNSITGKTVGLGVNGTNQLTVDGTSVNVLGTNNLNFTAVGGGAYSVGFGNTATTTAATITLVAQNAGGAGPTAGGAVGLVSGSPAGAGNIGQVTLFFGGVASTSQIVFQGGANAAALGTMQWSSALTPVLSQASESTATKGTDFTITPQQSTHATDQGGGNLIVALQTPAGAGVEAFLGLTRGGTRTVTLGAATSTSQSLWFGSSTPSGTNYALNQTNAGAFQINAVTQHLFEFASVDYLTLTTGGLAGGTNAGNPLQFLNQTINNPTTLNLVTTITSGTQLASPNLTLTGTISTNWTIQFGTGANGIAGRWEVDVNQLTFNSGNLTFQVGSSGTTVIAATSLTTTADLIIVRTDGAGHIAINH